MEKILRIEDVNGNFGGYRIITDQQTVELLIENESSCCENWGWFWCNDNPQDFIGAELINISITDDALNNHIMEKNNRNGEWEGGVMFVNIETNIGLLQFVAYNEHNGYYSHTAKVTSRQLNHKEYL